MSKNDKAIPWLDIKIKYLNGSAPTDLAKEYKKFKVTEKQIYNKAFRENWKSKKEKLEEKIEEKILEKRIATSEEILKELTHLALFDETIKPADKIKALELLGKKYKLFTDKIESNNNNTNVGLMIEVKP